MTKEYIKNQEELEAQIAQQWAAAQDFKEKRVSKRNEATDYFVGNLPVAECGKPSYVASIVRNAVQSMQPMALEVFNEGDGFIVRSNGIEPDEKLELDKASVILNTIYYDLNNGKELNRNAIFEMLLYGDTFGKVSWEIKDEKESHTITDWTPEPELADLYRDWPQTDWSTLDKKAQFTKKEKEAIVSLGAEEQIGDLNIKMVKGEVLLERTTKLPCVQQVPFGQIFPSADSYTSSIEDCSYVAQILRLTRQEAIDLELDEELVLGSLIATEENQTLLTDVLTDGMAGDSMDYQEQQHVDTLTEYIYVFEHYISSSIPTGEVSLYQVFTNNIGKILKEPEEVSEQPFVHGYSSELPTSFWGMGLAEEFGPEQDLISELYRSIDSNVQTATYGRWQAVKGAYDRRSLLDARPGGVVEVQKLGAVDTLPYHQLPQSVPLLLDSIKKDTQKYVGTSVSEAVGNNLQGVAASAIAMQVDNEEAQGKAKIHCMSDFFKLLAQKVLNTLRMENINNGLSIPTDFSIHIDVMTKNDRAKELIFHQTQFQEFVAVKEQLGELSAYLSAKHNYEVAAISGFSERYKDPRDITPEQKKAKEEEMLKTQNIKETIQDLAFQKEGAEIAGLLIENSKNESEAKVKGEEIKMKAEANLVKEQNETLRLQLEQQRLTLSHEKDMALLALETRKAEMEFEIESKQHRPAEI